MNHSLYQDGILKALPFKRLPCARGQRKQSKTFPNNPGGWRQIVTWLKSMGVEQAHICLEATGCFGAWIHKSVT
jgi:hypothetical protein